LYESGLPVWAIFLPTYGLYYRPWMRRLTWILFIAVSVFSMACGFYDLYKNVPHVDKVSSHRVACWLPTPSQCQHDNICMCVCLAMTVPTCSAQSTAVSAVVSQLATIHACLAAPSVMTMSREDTQLTA